MKIGADHGLNLYGNIRSIFKTVTFPPWPDIGNGRIVAASVSPVGRGTAGLLFMKGIPLPESGSVDGLVEYGLGELAECGRRGKLYAGVDGKCPPEVGEGAAEGEMPGTEAIVSKSF